MHRAAPLHPIFVHFTIALVGTSLLFDALGRIYGLTSLLSAAWWTYVPVTIPLFAVTALAWQGFAPSALGAWIAIAALWLTFVSGFVAGAALVVLYLR